MSSSTRWAAAAALLAFTAGLARVSEAGLQFLDSWCYARVAAEMAASGDWILPRWRGEPFLEKPPLLFWLSAAIYRLFGVSESAARLLVGASTAGCVLLTFGIGAAAAGPRAGMSGALLLCATPMFLKWGRTYTTDPLFTLLSLAAVGCGWGAARRGALWPAAGALAALAVLTRGAAAAPLLVTLAFLAARSPGEPPPGREARGAPSLAWVLAGVAAFLALAIPWHLAAAQQAGEDFVRVYLGEHTLERAHRNLIDSPRAADPLYYPLHLLRTGWPALPFLAWGLVRLRQAWEGKGTPAGRLDRALLAYLGAHAVMLTAVASRSPRYLLPVYPALALLAGRGLAGRELASGVDSRPAGAARRRARHTRRWVTRLVVAAALAVSLWPSPIGTPRGAEWRALAAAIERSAAIERTAVRVEVDPALIDPWFERAFWFYLGRDPRASEAGNGPRLLLRPVDAAAGCLPPGCRVMERGARFVLLAPAPPAPEVPHPP